jgi:hypothetical protein
MKNKDRREILKNLQLAVTSILKTKRLKIGIITKDFFVKNNKPIDPERQDLKVRKTYNLNII